MRKERFLLAMLAASLLFLSGCDDSTAEAKQYECEQWLNDGEYDKLISSASQCGSSQEQQMYKAAAHAGKAGFTLTALIANLTEEDEGNNSDFVERLGKGATKQSVADLNDSKRIYGLLIDPDAANDAATLKTACRKDSAEYNASTRYQRDACFIRPLVSTAQLASQMNRIRKIAELDVDDPESMTGEEKEEVAGSLATLINDGELELLAETLGAEETSTDGEDKSTSEAVDEVTKEMCIDADGKSYTDRTGTPRDASCTGADEDGDGYPDSVTNWTILWISESENN